MAFAEWLAAQQPLFATAVAIVTALLVFPLLAAQRAGRGIKPWWATCRYLALMGIVGGLLALASAYLELRLQGLSTLSQLMALLFEGPWTPLRWSLLLPLLAWIVGLACFRSLFRNRKEGLGIGVLALVLGLVWCGLAAAALRMGLRVRAPRTAAASSPQPAPQPLVIRVPAPDPETQRPARALDFVSLVPVHTDPVKSPAHGGRWIRAWVSPEAAEDYKAGRPLPTGALVVLSTLEDRWGRPGWENGPLYFLEMKKEGPELGFYWAQVPAARRAETQGAERAYWRGQDPALRSCMSCHANGTAPLKDRSQWKIPPRKPKAEGSTAGSAAE